MLFLFLFQVVKQTKLDTSKSPCSSDPDYSYQECLEKEMINKVGCQPSWLDISKSTNKTCTRDQMLIYLRDMLAINSGGRKTIFLKYGCQRPCEYFEYKVALKH